MFCVDGATTSVPARLTSHYVSIWHANGNCQSRRPSRWRVGLFFTYRVKDDDNDAFGRYILFEGVVVVSQVDMLQL
jgi:hypothetical protein